MVKCNARKYVNRKRSRHEMEPCTKSAKYGCLCSQHARQISGTPTGFQYNRIVRIHLPDLDDEEIAESIEAFRKERGDVKHLPRNPLSFKEDVWQFIDEEPNGRTAGEVVAFVHRLVDSNRMTSAQVGSILGTLSREKRVVRRLTSVDRGDGKYVGSAVYVAV